MTHCVVFDVFFIFNAYRLVLMQFVTWNFPDDINGDNDCDLL